MKNYYELLGVAPSASSRDIKQAFRQQIARYHPDKVQHLGREFQELAAARAAELTEAYRVLIDAARRAEYDVALRAWTEAPHPGEEGPTETGGWSPWWIGLEEWESRNREAPPPAREAREARHEYVRRAALERFAAAVGAALGDVEPLAARGFDVAFRTKGRRGLLRADEALGVCGRVLPAVDPEAIRMTWNLAARVGPLDLSLCVFLMSEQLAPRRELAVAVAAVGRRTRIARSLVIVPTDVRDWQALVPTGAPPAVRRIVATLKSHP